MLQTLAVLLAAAAVAVPLSRRGGFGSVLGYLVAGVAIGPAGAGLISDVEQIRSVAELGVIMLMFLIGIELRPARLWVMRDAVFALGGAQVAVTAAALAGGAMLFGLHWQGAAVLGVGFALSSTAIVLPMLAERDLLAGRAGRDAFAVLLFQDLAFIPLVALIPLLGGELPNRFPLRDVAIGAAAIAGILVGGRLLLRPAFRAVGGARVPEMFSLMALLTVIGAAWIATSAGLSASLGAFMAGVLLSDSEYRHELQADIAPFEGLLLGFFFISVGMGAQLGLVAQHPLLIALGVLGVMSAKAIVAYALGRISGQNASHAARFALALPQGSEFSFVLFAAAIAVGALAEGQAEAATLIVALTMVATPLVFAAAERFLQPRLAAKKKEPVYDVIDSTAPVILCGFGRVGQIVGRILRMQSIDFVALEGDPEQLDVVRRFGNKVFYGDPTRPDLLRAAGAETAKLLVVALEDVEATLRVVEIARRNFPNLKIVSRARNRFHVHQLLDRGIDKVVRDTFHSSLKLSELALEALDIPKATAQRSVALFAENDERTLLAAHAIYQDEARLIQSTQQAATELAGLFEADRSDMKEAERK